MGLAGDVGTPQVDGRPQSSESDEGEEHPPKAGNLRLYSSGEKGRKGKDANSIFQTILSKRSYDVSKNELGHR